MPTLENHSGFDRDNRSISKEVAVKPQIIDAVRVTLPDEPIEVETKAVLEPTRKTYDDWNDYPVHQAVLVYIQGKTDKSDRNVYDSIKKKVDPKQWDNIPGQDNMAKLKNVLSYLTNKGQVFKNSANSYSSID
jgi:hypothetical protein